jgi:hypothetical protein
MSPVAAAGWTQLERSLVDVLLETVGDLPEPDSPRGVVDRLFRYLGRFVASREARRQAGMRAANLVAARVFEDLLEWDRGGKLSVQELGELVPHFRENNTSIELTVVAESIEVARHLSQLSVDSHNSPADQEIEHLAYHVEALARLLQLMQRPATAARLASRAVALLRYASLLPPRRLKNFALNAMDSVKKTVFITAVARAKFPPPRETPYGYDFMEEAVFATLAATFLPRAGTNGMGQDAFNANVEAMMRDPVFVVTQNAGIATRRRWRSAEVEDVRFEFRFAQPLLQRVADKVAVISDRAVTPYQLLNDLLQQVVARRSDFIQSKDEQLFTWFRLRGALPYRRESHFEDCVLYALASPGWISVVVGETESDITPAVRYEFLAEKTIDALQAARSLLVERGV